MTKLISIGILAVFIGKSLCEEVEDKFKATKIVDDLIPKAPQAFLNVEFDCGVTTLGNKFAPIQVRNRPKVTWRKANETEFYSLIMTDAIGKKEFLQWLVGNIAGSIFDKAVQLAMFFPSAPSKESGEHRYVFLWYKQPGKIDFTGYERTSTFQMEGRDKFNTTSFVDKFKLGSPLAGNFYLASWDESCEELYKFVDKNKKNK